MLASRTALRILSDRVSICRITSPACSKPTAAPQPTNGFFSFRKALHPVHTWGVCPMDGEGYSLRDNVKVVGIGEMLRLVREIGTAS
jgi:hypothetical protein